MKGFNFFKNYPTKTEYNTETQAFEERSAFQSESANMDHSSHIDPQAPLALAYVMFGLKQPTKRRTKY